MCSLEAGSAAMPIRYLCVAAHKTPHNVPNGRATPILLSTSKKGLFSGCLTPIIRAERGAQEMWEELGSERSSW